VREGGLTIQILGTPVAGKGTTAPVDDTLSMEGGVEADALVLVRDVKVHNGAEEPEGGGAGEGEAEGEGEVRTAKRERREGGREGGEGGHTHLKRR